MPAKPKLFLHIGHPKTASSTLQAFLFKNWRLFEAAGFSLPTETLACASEDAPAGNPLWALQDIREKGDASPIRNWVIAERKKPSFANKLILSSECLTQPEWPALFKGVTELVDINLIYYVRRQDQLLLSAWRQWGLKRGLSLGEFLSRRLKNKQPDFLSTVENWTQNTPIKQCHIRFIQQPFLYGNGIIEDFCNHIGFEPRQAEPVENQNVSVDARLLMFMSGHPELFDDVHDEEIFNLLRHPNKTEPAQRLTFTKEQFEAVQETFEPLNQSLLHRHHPALAGTPVIDTTSARFSDSTINTDRSAQIAYIEECLAASPNPDHPKLSLLRQKLAIR